MPIFNIHVHPVIDPSTKETLELPNDLWEKVEGADKYRAVEQLLNSISIAKDEVYIPEKVYVEKRQMPNGTRVVEELSIGLIH